MVTMGVFPFQGKAHMVEPGIEPGTLWLVVRNSDHQATRLVVFKSLIYDKAHCIIVHLLVYCVSVEILQFQHVANQNVQTCADDVLFCKLPSRDFPVSRCVK